MAAAAPTYRELTFADRNPIKRWLQRSRLTSAIRMAQQAPPPRTILDFGAGNGAHRNQVSKSEAGYIDARPQSRQIDETSCDPRPSHTYGSFAMIVAR